ncbi:hypothetical protein LSTR_LSTR010176 [Laodelphax striatellus]|uniref:Uncharacterized protein n=1 Tax=Laodelphax striatellus TaxID=195883 RepID=A0A482XM49_LAOST|nr:hypothetical protein LSTR_LSTR010176 [Laodelphax striatellus]
MNSSFGSQRHGPKWRMLCLPDGCVKFDRAEEYSPLEHEPGREIAYDLSSSLIHFRFLNDNGGPVVEVGSKWTQKYMEASEVTCHISAGARLDFKTEYHLRVSTTQVVTGGNNVKAELTLNQLNDKFKVVRNEAYECKPVGMNKVAFIKVVNKLETKVDLSAIFYTDGVSLWKSSASPGAYFIREVKFVDSQDPKTIYKFEGNVKNKFEKSTDRFDEGSSIEEERAQVDSTDEDQKQMWYKDYQAWLARGKSGYEPLEDIRYTPGVKSKIVQQFSGYNIRVGSEWVKEIGEKRQKFVCVEDKTQYDELELLPKIDVYQDYDLYALDKDTMGDYFKITSKNVLKCSKNHQSFIRVRTELVGKAAIRRVYYWPGVKAFSHKLSTSHNTVRLVELKYLDPADGYKVVKFEGTLEKRP